MPSQSDHELEDEVCEDETHDNVPSRMCEMTAMEDNSHGFQSVQLIRHGFHGCHLPRQSSHACGSVHSYIREWI